MPNAAKNLGLIMRCLHLIGWKKQSKLAMGAIFSICSLQEWLVQSYAARLHGNIFLNFVLNLSLGGGTWVLCLWHQHIFKMGYILDLPVCSTFEPFHFYLVMTLVVPSFDNILTFTVFADFQSSKNLCDET